jgi:hypothetical protein
MVTLRDLHRYQTNRNMVQLEDGRIGKIVRVDTTFPGNRTVVSVYTVAGPQGPSGQARSDQARSDQGGAGVDASGHSADLPPDEGSDVLAASESRNGPGITRVSLERIVGLAKVPA